MDVAGPFVGLDDLDIARVPHFLMLEAYSVCCQNDFIITF